MQDERFEMKIGGIENARAVSAFLYGSRCASGASKDTGRRQRKQDSGCHCRSH